MRVKAHIVLALLLFMIHSVTVPPCVSRSKRYARCTFRCHVGVRLTSDCLADGNHPTRTLHLHFLRQGMFKPFLILFMGTNYPLIHRLIPGLCKTYRCRNLELPFMQEGDCWGCMDCVNHCGCYCAQVSSVTMCS